MRTLSTLILLFLASCANSMQNRDASCKERITDGKIEHKITYTRRGARSEARHGHLMISGNKLPDVFTLVKCGNNFYKFYQRENLWGNDGYFPAEASEVGIPPPGGSDKQISGNELTRGWYKGGKRHINTPSNWIYVRWSKGRAFVSPGKIRDMISEIRILTIPRFKPLPIKTNIRQ